MGFKHSCRPDEYTRNIMLPTKLIALNFWRKYDVCICLCQISNLLLACNLEETVQMLGFLQGINESMAAYSVLVAYLFFRSNSKQVLLFESEMCSLAHKPN